MDESKHLEELLTTRFDGLKDWIGAKIDGLNMSMNTFKTDQDKINAHFRKDIESLYDKHREVLKQITDAGRTCAERFNEIEHRQTRDEVSAETIDKARNETRARTSTVLAIIGGVIAILSFLIGRGLL